MKKILYSIIFLLVSLHSITLLYSSEIKLNVNLLPTGQYNVSDFLNPSVSLWTVITECIDCPEEGLDYRLEVKLSFNDIQPAIWGVTYIRNLTMDGFDEMTNFDFQGGAGLLVDYTEDEDFIAQLEETYYLPAGNVELSVTAYEACPYSSSWREDYKVDCDQLSDSDEDSYFSTFNNVVSELTLLSPANNEDVLDTYPLFRWESPGFTDGVQIDYKLFVYKFDPAYHSTYLEAIEDENYLYFSTEITDQFENGTANQIQVQYPSNDRELACGYQYVWFIEANDIIQDEPFNGESGIWGWPEPISSPVYTFNYGSSGSSGGSSGGVISPAIGSTVETVRPTFHTESTGGCANSYEIWLSDSEDSEVENPIWMSGALSSNINVYPIDATGLIPNSNYKWKIRLNPDGEPGPWSDIFDFSISGFSLDEPGGTNVGSITPTFYFTVPSDISSYELRVSNFEDQMVEVGNIFNESIPGSGFTLPSDLSVGLMPAEQYFWKLIFYDGNDNMVGDIDYYTVRKQFKIKPVVLSSPSDNSTISTITPSFIWNGVTGIPLYELSISRSDDSQVEDPFFTESISGTFFQYPQFAETPLESGQIYFWKITPIDENGNRGEAYQIWKFTSIISNDADVDTTSDFGSDDDSDSDSTWDSDDDFEVEGCTDMSACNYDSNAQVDDGSCEYMYDCSGSCGGNKVIDDCGVCGGDNSPNTGNCDCAGIPNGDTDVDCNGVCNGDAEVDICGTCNGGVTNYDYCQGCTDSNACNYNPNVQVDNGSCEYTSDCLSVCGGSAIVDDCGICNGGNENMDCAGECNGSATIDCAGVCGGDAIRDACGICNGAAIDISECQGCTDPDACNYNPDVMIDAGNCVYIIDCLGICGGSTVLDDCGVCGGDNSPNTGNCDCTGIPNGESQEDICGVCNGTSTNTAECGGCTDPTACNYNSNISVDDGSCEYTMDCAGVCGGSSLVDDCNVCNGGNANMDCAGVCNGDAVNDCTGVCNGDAQEDICGICNGTSTMASDCIQEEAVVNTTIASNLAMTYESDMAFSTKPEFSISNGPENSPRTIIINLLAAVMGTTEYIIYFSLDQGMGSPFETLSLMGNQIEVALDASNLEWNSTIYVQIIAMEGTAEIGDPSSVQVINLPSKPGSDDQVGISISLESGSTKPIIEIINEVTNGINYVMDVSTDSELSEVFYSGPFFDNMATIYPDSAPLLMFGETYYFQVYATDDDGPHGIPSSITALFIPNIIAPSLQNEFSWEATIPEANIYFMQISTTDDFSSVVIEGFVESLSYILPENSLNPGTLYYWRVQGYDSNNSPYGSTSNARFFETEGEQVVAESIEGGQIVNLKSPTPGEQVSSNHPSFQWEAIDSAEKYEIRISTSEDYSEIIWQSSNVAQNSVQYPSTGGESLISETIYYWSVRAIYEDVALGEFSETFQFTVSEDNTPVLTGPMNETSETIYPYFTWNKIPRASSYGLILGKDEGCKQVIIESSNITEKHFQYPSDAPPLDYDKSYYWKVIAYDGNENELGDYSTIATFKTPSGVIEIEFIYSGNGE